MQRADSLFRAGRIAGATVTVLALGTALAACGGNDGDRAAPSATATGTSTVTAPASDPAQSSAPGAASSAPAPVSAAESMLSDLRIGRNDGHDRVVLQFTGAAPKYTITSAKGPIQECASGETVAGAGDYLVITIPSIALFDDDGNSAYSGPKKVTGPGPYVGDATIACAFEGRLEVAVRLLQPPERHTDMTLTDPGRIAVDVWRDQGA